jgi:hypothetical protein
VLQTLIFDVADVEFDIVDMWCWVLCRGGGGLLMLDVARNMVATWGEEGGDPLMFECCTQHARNMARNGSKHRSLDFTIQRLMVEHLKIGRL